MSILLRADDFLILFLNYITQDKDALYDPFLTSPKILQNIFHYSARSSTTKFLAQSFIEAVVDKMALDSTFLLEANSEADHILDENLFIVTALVFFPNLQSRPEYRSWCDKTASNKNYESQLVRRIIERNFEFKNRIRILPIL